MTRAAAERRRPRRRSVVKNDDRLLRDVKDNLRCSVCFKVYAAPLVCSQCSHVTCRACFTKLSTYKCPVCNDSIVTFSKNPLIDRVVNNQRCLFCKTWLYDVYTFFCAILFLCRTSVSIGDIFHPDFQDGRPAYFDVTVRNTLQPAFLAEAAICPGVAAEAGEAAKDLHHAAAVEQAGGVFLPLAGETFGVWTPHSIATLKRIAARTTISSGDIANQALQNLLQQLSVWLWQFNARLVRSRLQVLDRCCWLASSRLAFLRRHVFLICPPPPNFTLFFCLSLLYIFFFVFFFLTKDASNWPPRHNHLSATPSACVDNWQPDHLPAHCPWGQAFSISHALFAPLIWVHLLREALGFLMEHRTG